MSLEFGAVSMRFSAADAMFAWICMCSEGGDVFLDLRYGLVWPLWFVQGICGSRLD